MASVNHLSSGMWQLLRPEFYNLGTDSRRVLDFLSSFFFLSFSIFFFSYFPSVVECPLTEGAFITMIKLKLISTKKLMPSYAAWVGIGSNKHTIDKKNFLLGPTLPSVCQGWHERQILMKFMFTVNFIPLKKLQLFCLSHFRFFGLFSLVSISLIICWV